MANKPNPRNANGHRRRELRKRVLASEDTCGICGQPVDVTLPHGRPDSPEVDEIIPVSLGGDPLARSNVRLAHRRPSGHDYATRDAATKCRQRPAEHKA